MEGKEWRRTEGWGHSIDIPIRDGEEEAGSLKRNMSRRTVRMLKRW